MDLTSATTAVNTAITDVQAAAAIVLTLVVAVLAVKAVIKMFRG